MKTIHPGRLEHRFCIFECQILCIPFLAIMPQVKAEPMVTENLNSNPWRASAWQKSMHWEFREELSSLDAVILANYFWTCRVVTGARGWSMLKVLKWFSRIQCWSHQLSLPLRSIVRMVKSVLGNSEVPDGYLGLGHLLSCHCWQAPNTYWHRSPCLCQNNEKPFSKGSREQRQQGQGVHSPARAL